MRKLRITSRVSEISYAIRDVILPAKELEKKGHKIIYLNIGDPLKYDFKTPTVLKKALVEAVSRGRNGYAQSEGESEFRKAVVYKEKRINNVKINSDNVFACSGLSSGIRMLLGSIIERGDELLMPAPTYPLYPSVVKFFGGIPVFYNCAENKEWEPSVEDIRKKITDKTKALLLINPNNPTGSLYSSKKLKEIICVCAEEGVLIISDEIYDMLTFDKEFHSTASLTDYPVIGLNGISKTYLAPGWRLGYIYLSDPNDKLVNLREALGKFSRMNLSTNLPVNLAAASALSEEPKHLNKVISVLRERRNFTYKRLNEISGVSVVKPEGAFYAFPKIDLGNKWASDKDFVLDFLHSKKVLFVHGSGFGVDSHFRTVFLAPIETLEEAFNKLDDFLKSA